MTERVVVSCRMNGEDIARLGARFLEVARALVRRAEALGGAMIAWDGAGPGFAFDAGAVEEAFELAGDACNDDPKWACGVARGALEALAVPGREAAWGAALVTASMLARGARAGETLVDERFEQAGELVTFGRRVGRGGRDDEAHAHGLRVDPRRPWKRDAGRGVERMTTPPYVPPWGSPGAPAGAHRPRVDLASLLATPGVLHVVRADPGHGGTRFLMQVAAAVAPGLALYLAPTGASVEPLGALRRAVLRALAQRPYPSDPDLAPVIDMFLGGIGASIDQAAAIVAALLEPVDAGAAAPGVLLLDDVGEVDAESLEACAQVIAAQRKPFHAFARVDATDRIPPALAQLPRCEETELGPMERAPAEATARGATGGALDARAAKRCARRAMYAPLGVIEAVAYAITSGDVVWSDPGVASLRSRVAFAGKPHPARHYVAKRAKATAPDERGVLAAIALFGGEAMVGSVKAALAIVDERIKVEHEIAKLIARRWLVTMQPGWIGLPSRTHRDTIAELLDEAPRRELHRALSEVLEQTEGELGCAEAAHHAVKAGDGARGARLALRAATAASAAMMSKSANRLLTLARLADPRCEPLTRQQLMTSLPPPQMPSVLPSHGHVQLIAAREPPQPPPTARMIADDAPTDRIAAMTAAQAAATIAKHDSDIPNVIRVPNGSILRAEAPLPFDDAPEAIGPIEPAPSASSPSPPSTRALRVAPVVPRPGNAPPPPPPPLPPPSSASEPTLPKPMAPPPLRVSTQGLPQARVPPPVPPPSSGARPAPRPSGSMVAAPPVSASQGPSPPSPPRPPPATPGARPPPPPPSSRGNVPAAPPLASGLMPAPRTLGQPVAVTNAPQVALPSSHGVALGGPDLSVATRIVDLAKSALLEGDAAAVERWTEGLRAAGHHDRVASRIEAIARLTRGQVGEALRTLREARDGASGAPPLLRAQASLALGLALAAANREQEALLAGLEALARAREGNDARAADACLAFLAKLYARVARADEAEKLKAAIKRA